LIQKDLISLIARVIEEAGYQMPASQIILETPKSADHGDFSTSVALRLATQHKLPPIDIASKITSDIQAKLKSSSKLKGKIDKIDVKGGFINFFLSKMAVYECLQQVQKQAQSYGSCDEGKRKKVQIEFVSANPTGPLSVAHGRQAAVGDSLGNILALAGYKVSREYFVNDEGRQMQLLGESIQVRYNELFGKETALPDDGYRGAYVIDIAKAIKDEYKDKFLGEISEKTKKFFVDYGCKYLFEVIKKDLEAFGVNFNEWTSQAVLQKAGRIEKVLKKLRKDNHLYEKDGALWFKSTAFGDDKDRVVIKSDGSFTYLAPDIAYHENKFKRGFDMLINIWGPDHHGYIARLKAAVAALGHPKDSLHVLIVQLATLYEGKKVIPMSTRAGEFITLSKVTKEVGRDAARFFFLKRKISSHLDFDLELAKAKSLENPVYYIQYAHARICNIFELAKDKKILKQRFKPELLTQPEEIRLAKTLSQFPKVIASCAKALEPYGLLPYLQGLAGDFHSFYDKCRVVDDENPELSKSRLVLIDSARIVLANGLCVLGISAPKKM